MMRILPRPVERALRRSYYRQKAVEPEILHLADWCPAGGVAIDVGGNRGDYSLFLAQLASKVYCFEPNPSLSVELKRLLTGLPVEVQNIGLGDEEGEFDLNIPYVDGLELHGWAGLNRNFIGQTWKGREVTEVRTVTVPVKRLDDLGITGVSFIKIDVEGHEFAVLKGAEELIRRDGPNLLIEIEERHHSEPIQQIFDWLDDQGYAGSFLDGGVMRDISEFDSRIHQKDPDTSSYRNNFLFRKK